MSGVSLDAVSIVVFVAFLNAIDWWSFGNIDVTCFSVFCAVKEVDSFG